MNPILIHKSDSTIFADVDKFLTFYLETGLDLTDWQAKFILGWVEKTIDDISEKSFEVVLSAQDTKQLRLGKQYGTIILTDSNGNIKTVTNTIPFEVTTAVVENEYQEIDLTIPESFGVDIKLKVGTSGGAVTSVNGMSGDVVIEIPNLTDYVKNTDYGSDSKAGIVKGNSSYGITVFSGGMLVIQSASGNDIENKSNQFRPITPKNMDYALKNSITTNIYELTEEEKASAQSWLGVDTLVGDINTILDTINGEEI